MTGRPNCAPVLIAAGGTGGHVIPALVVAQELLKRQIPVVWVGTRRGLEFSLIPAAGIPIEWLDVVGFTWQESFRIIFAVLINLQNPYCNQYGC